MAGLYVHIPFCKSRCIYCSFCSTTRLDLRDRYVDAVLREWAMRRGQLAEPVATLYVGGGTPSVLTSEQLTRLLRGLCDTVSAATLREVTVECNPDDVDDDWARLVAAAGAGRVSMGAQTFSDARLRFLHRRHTSAQVAAAVHRLRAAGIGNISIDLMYGFPGETLAEWRRDVEQAVALGVEHLSAYALIYEEDTPLGRMLGRGAVSEVDEELSLQMYDHLVDRLTAAGYEHYEISNFALPGRRSRHNSSYWNQTPYVGLGAAAHSYDGERREWNTADVEQYIAGMERGERLFESETIDAHTRYNDIVTTALRTCEGIGLASLDAEHRDYLMRMARRYIASGLLKKDEDALRLSRQGIFVSDMVMADLMWV